MSAQSPAPSSEQRASAPAQAKPEVARTVAVVEEDATRDARADARSEPTRSARPKDTLAAAFAPLDDGAAHHVRSDAKRTSQPASSESGRSTKAREIASRLSAKAPPHQRQTQAGASARPSTAQRALASPPPKISSRRPNEASHRQPRTQGQIAAVALTDLQLDALRALRRKNEEEDDRWLVLFVMMFLMLLLQLGLPLLYEPQMARAQALFGAKLRWVSAGFTVVVVIATVRIWAAHIRSNSLLVRATSFTMLVVAAAVSVLCATRFTSSGGAARFAGWARTALPWGMGLLFFLFAFGGMLRGARSLSSDVLYGVLVMLLSTGSLYGSYRAVFSTVLAGKHWNAGARARDRHATGPNLRDLTELKRQASDKTSMAQWQEDHQDLNAMEQRHELGADEAEDLKSTSEITDTRARNQAMLQKAVQEPLAAPPGAPLRRVADGQ
jgi:hypothetical protein